VYTRLGERPEASFLVPSIADRCRPTSINFSHDLFSPPDRIGDGTDGGRHPSPAIVLRQSPGSEDAGGDQQNSLSSLVHGVRHPEARREPHAGFASGTRIVNIALQPLVVKLQAGFYRFRFLFAIRKRTGAMSKSGALGGCDRRPESTAGWCKRLCAGCEQWGGIRVGSGFSR